MRSTLVYGNRSFSGRRGRRPLQKLFTLCKFDAHIFLIDNKMLKNLGERLLVGGDVLDAPLLKILENEKRKKRISNSPL